MLILGTLIAILIIINEITLVNKKVVIGLSFLHCQMHTSLFFDFPWQFLIFHQKRIARSILKIFSGTLLVSISGSRMFCSTCL